MVRSRRLRSLLGWSVVVVVLAVAPAQAAAETLVVDDGFRNDNPDAVEECPESDFSRIQEAVDAAEPDDTVRVCPGLYRESVEVPKKLRLEGAREEPFERCGRLPLVRRDAIVDPPDDDSGNGFLLRADDVVLERFVVTGTDDNAGIQTSPEFSGYAIRRNRVLENVFGVYLNASGEKLSTVEGNCLSRNNREGAASGNGVYSDQGLERARIAGNRSIAHRNAAITLAGEPETQSAIDVRGNQSSEESLIALFNVEGARIRENLVIRSRFAAITLGGGNSEVAVTANTLRRGQASGIALEALTGTDNEENVIADNRVRLMGFDGIRLGDGSKRNTVRGNLVEESIRDGLRANANARRNTFEGNRSVDSEEHDCHDDSEAGRSRGTANIWRDNVGETSTPRRLCTPPDEG